MKTTRILLADRSGTVCEAALRLHHVLPSLSAGTCAVRSADDAEPLTRWHPDLVLLDPDRNEGGGAAPEPGTKAQPGASRVLVLTFSYGQTELECSPSDQPVRHSSGPRLNPEWHLASATIQAVEMKNPVLSQYQQKRSRSSSPGFGERFQHAGRARVDNFRLHDPIGSP